MQSLNITEVKLDCFKTFRGISFPITLLVEVFLATFSISSTVTGLKENLCLIVQLLLVFLILGWLLYLLITLVSCSSVYSVSQDSHSKVFNLSTVSEKYLWKIFAISSYLTFNFSFSTTSLLLKITFSFLIRIILDSPWTCLLEKQGLHFFQNGLEFFDVSKFSKYSILLSLFNLATRFR